MIDELDASFLDDPFMADVAFKEAPEIVTGSRDGKKHLTLNWMQRNVESTFTQCISLYCIIYYPTSNIIGNNSESIKQSFMTASRLENSPEEAVNERVVCDVDCIIQPLGKTCRQPNCQASISYKKNNVGCTLNIQWKCLQGHSSKWSISKRCYHRNGILFLLTMS